MLADAIYGSTSRSELRSLPRPPPERPEIAHDNTDSEPDGPWRATVERPRPRRPGPRQRRDGNTVRERPGHADTSDAGGAAARARARRGRVPGRGRGAYAGQTGRDAGASAGPHAC